MNDWIKIKLEEVVITSKGNAFKSEDYLDRGVPVVRASDFTTNSISSEELVYVSKKISEKSNKYILQCGDVLIQTVGSWQHNPASVVGKVVRVPKELEGSLLNQNIVKIIPTESIDKTFLYYRLKDEAFTLHNLGCAQGAANQASITLSTIKSFKFSCPPLESQRKIGMILNTYDKYIENNLYRIKLLEEMMRITYEEWFLRLKFPNHETEKFNSKTGLPVTWSEWDLNDLISIKHGYAYKGDFFCEHETSKILLTPGNVKIGGGLKAEKMKYYDDEAENPTDYILSRHDLLLTMTDLSKMADTLGYPLLVPSSENKTYLHNQRLGKVLPVDDSLFPKYFYYMLFQDVRYRGSVVGSSTGSTVKHTSPSKILNYAPRLPPLGSPLIEKFDAIAKGAFNVIDNLMKEIDLLTEGRDILLPRLMTGMIDFEQVELPEAMLKRFEQ